MANEQGREYRVYVKTGANAFTAIGGETSCSFKRSRSEQDKSDKDTGAYGATGHGRQSVAISSSGNLKLPDAGFVALDAASKLDVPEIEVQIKKGTIVKYHGLVSIGSLNAEFPEGLATWSAEMTNAAAPIVDNLTAADVTP